MLVHVIIPVLQSKVPATGWAVWLSRTERGYGATRATPLASSSITITNATTGRVRRWIRARVVDADDADAGPEVDRARAELPAVAGDSAYVRATDGEEVGGTHVLQRPRVIAEADPDVVVIG